VSVTKAEFESAVFKFRDVDPARMGSYFMSEVPVNNKYDYSAFINTTAQAGTAYYINRMNSAILKEATGGKISMSVAPLPYTYEEIGFEKNMGGAFVFAYVAIGSAFIPALITQFLTMEIECNIKHQQIVSGVSLLAYWLANFTMDISKYMIFGILSPLLIMAFNVEVLLTGGNIGMLWGLFLVYGFTIIMFSYVMSFSFKESTNAQLVMFLIAFLGGYLLGFVMWVLRLLPAT